MRWHFSQWNFARISINLPPQTGQQGMVEDSKGIVVRVVCAFRDEA